MAKKKHAVKQSDGPQEDVVDELLRDWRRERPDLDAAPMAVVGRVLNLGRILEARANECLKDTGLNYTDLDVLATLRRSGAPFRLAPTVLRKSVLITSGAMTACLNRLEHLGLLTRSLDADDRRSLTATLTSKGLRLIDKTMSLRFAEAGQAVATLSRNEQAALSGLLRKLGVGLR